MMDLDSFELRIEITKVIAQELLWRALAPEGIVLLGALHKAIVQQQELLGVVSTGYAVSGVSVIQGNGSTYAEITYTRPALT